jgi:hypothetical protein
MVSAELLNTLRGLKRADKLYIMQVLISELAQEETDLIKPDQAYPVFSWRQGKCQLSEYQLPDQVLVVAEAFCCK